MSKKRILVIAHGHPDFSKGGAEICAHNLHKEYQDTNRIERSFLLACKPNYHNPSGDIFLYKNDEYLWDQALGDWFYLKGTNRRSSLKKFREWISIINPDIVHVHHYLHMGLEIFNIIKQVCPRCVLLLTLHEYIAICHNSGQMLKAKTYDLCKNTDVQHCTVCYPEYKPELFWLRKQFIKQHFDFIDFFISPSVFLRDKYVAWGVDPRKIFVIPNGQIPSEAIPPRDISDRQSRNRFAFFGQINEFKGVDILLQAFDLVSKESSGSAFLEIHGNMPNHIEEKTKTKILNLVSKLTRRGILHWGGPYEQDQLPDLYKNIDWVIVPSIWWENAPLVIQESFKFRRPMIVSSIGGMAEMVANGKTGLHFIPKNFRQLADVIKQVCEDTGKWLYLYNNIVNPATVTESARQTLDLCEQAL